MPKSNESHASRPRKSDIHVACKECLVAVEEGVIEGNADLISIKRLELLGLLQLLLVLLNHILEFLFEILRELILKIGGYLPAPLTVAVTH